METPNPTLVRLEGVRRRIKSLEGFKTDDITLQHLVEEDIPWLMGAAAYLVNCNAFLVSKNKSLTQGCRHSNMVKPLDGPPMCLDCGKDVN